MTHRSLKPAFAITLLAVGLLAAAPDADADGLPIGNLDTSRTGIADPGGDGHLYAVPNAGRTAVLAVRGLPDPEGESLDTLHLDGTLVIPGVALDGTTSGISADGSTLVLIEPRVRFPRTQTHLTLIDPDRLEPMGSIDLRGDFSFDAISPDGGTIYLIHYLDPRDPTRYEVRAYDLEASRLLPEPIIDERLAPRVMRGYPITRENSPDGTWAYTLYDGGGGHHAEPFVHALNTENATALCIDLPMLDTPARELHQLRLEPSEDGATIDVLDADGEAVATIETGTWDASLPEADDAADQAGAGSVAPWVLTAAAATLLAALLLGGRATRRSTR